MPATISKVEVTSVENAQLTAIAGEDQLSLAIGKEEQNMRLASRLVGWHINIPDAEEAKGREN